MAAPLSEERKQEIAHYLQQGYGIRYTAKAVGSTGQTVKKIKDTMAYVRKRPPMPDHPPEPCEIHGEREWRPRKYDWIGTCWQCNKAGYERMAEKRRQAGWSSKGAYTLNAEQKGWRKMDETQISACFNGQRFQDEPKACKPEKMLRWQADPQYVPKGDQWM